MRELTERYVAAALRSIPEDQKSDIEAELRVSIDDAIEARVAGGGDARSAETEVLTELGDPDRLAAGYVGRPSYLIGPEHFFDYKRLLTVLLITVVPIVVTIVAVVQVVAGDSIASVLAQAFGSGLSLAVQIAFWTTLVFALIERGSERKTSEWTLSTLPLMPTAGTVRLGDTIGSVVFLVVAIAGLALSRTVSPVTGPDGSAISIFDPSVWDFWFPFFIVVLLIEIIFEVVKYWRGRWTWPLASLNVALNAVFAIPAVYLLTSGQIFNPVFFEEIGWGSEPAGDGTLVRVVVAAMIVIALWDIFDGFRKARKV